MRVQRNYNRPFFSNRRRGLGIRSIFFVGLFLGAVLVLFALQYDRIQIAALDAVGFAPTPTPLPSNIAMQGSVLFVEGDVQAAAQLFGQAMQQQPDNADYLYEYGTILIEMNMVDEAVPIAEQMIAVAPEDPRGYALKARTLMWDAPAEAIQAAILGIDIDPNFAPLYAASGVAYTNLGRWQEGLREGARAIEIDPMDRFSLFAYQFPLTYVGRYQEAIDYLEQSIALNPNLAEPYFYLARLYTLPGVDNPEMAIATYFRILEMEPDNAKANLRLCETFAGVDEADFREAQPYCDEAIRLDPTYASAYRQRGQMQYNRRNYEGAIESFERCIALGSEEIECYYLRGLAHYWLGGEDCPAAWDVLQDSRTRAQAQGEAESVLNAIQIGLGNIQANCSGYANVSVPTVPPPTSIPPTPIGGGYG
ncbi:MAG: tetratricopeptide repeat protein [Aggregatilineales bacterium]